MQPNPNILLEIAGITTPLIGFYDTPDTKPFEPFAKPKECIFSCYENWLKDESIFLSEENVGSIVCPGAGYWSCGVESMPRKEVAKYLGEIEGLKSSSGLMIQWLENQPVYKKKHPYVVIGPLREDQYEFLKTITFYVNPDQLSLLMTGAEYHNASVDSNLVNAPYCSGCRQLSLISDELDAPKAIIGATDIAMRQYLPPDTLALTVTKTMFQQLCQLDKNSFLYKNFWKRLRESREKTL
ncbi:MAG: DUF169 domain-containing protein [Deltaproteobacteria bacterium]|nr:DUF169 domain-containing protein [Deltaproteobacteria bacterium]